MGNRASGHFKQEWETGKEGGGKEGAPASTEPQVTLNKNGKPTIPCDKCKNKNFEKNHRAYKHKDVASTWRFLAI